ncbi:MAG: DUF1311 domain-containing protein [Hymenobacteraceae bacterium]|nr:DUF1311 domain-containing protein [Hymenobacteraceae bacterium]MDX5394591.1 DUF1311 domain-containing protein [Hymenobacteraceae bacterium]MDX5443152.1 DUF1311 domain-containing protein [Hymenobacteraceae bacterium]MDX5510619.1 DUF1311 domain-containing protein [Hymenobacteraceae bacterium]
MTKIVILSFLLIIASAFNPVLGQAKDWAIDVNLQSCLDSAQNQTNVGMISCSVRAKEAWDKELNKYYKLLMNSLSESEKEKLRNAQKNWLLYRNSETEFAAKLYTNLQGSMWRIVAANRQMEIVKQRTLELRQYYETLTEEK